MMAFGALLLAASLAFAADDGAAQNAGPAPSGPWTDLYGDTQTPTATYRIRLFVHAAQACVHFVGEEPYDAKRAAFLAAMIDDNCAGLAERYAAIVADPATDVESRKLVERVWEPLHE